MASSAPSMGSLVPWQRMEPGPPTLGAPRLSHCTTREVPHSLFLILCFATSVRKPLTKTTRLGQAQWELLASCLTQKRISREGTRAPENQLQNLRKAPSGGDTRHSVCYRLPRILCSGIHLGWVMQSRQGWPCVRTIGQRQAETNPSPWDRGLEAQGGGLRAPWPLLPAGQCLYIVSSSVSTCVSGTAHFRVSSLGRGGGWVSLPAALPVSGCTNDSLPTLCFGLPLGFLLLSLKCFPLFLLVLLSEVRGSDHFQFQIFPKPASVACPLVWCL